MGNLSLCAVYGVHTCPFCGQFPDVDFTEKSSRIECRNDDCHVRPNFVEEFSDITDTVHKWNSRVD